MLAKDMHLLGAWTGNPEGVVDGDLKIVDMHKHHRALVHLDQGI
jgi:hypothetical protein